MHSSAATIRSLCFCLIVAGLVLSSGAHAKPSARTASHKTAKVEKKEQEDFLKAGKKALAQRLTDAGSLSLAAQFSITSAPILTDGTQDVITATRQGPDIFFHISPALLETLKKEENKETSPLIIMHLASAIAEAECLWLCDWPDYIPPQKAIDSIKLATITSAINLHQLIPLAPEAVLRIPGCPLSAEVDLENIGEAITFDAKKGIITDTLVRGFIELGKPDGAGDPENPANPEATHER